MSFFLPWLRRWLRSQPPTIHNARNLSEYDRQLRQAEIVDLKLRRYYKYHALIREEIGREVEEAMRLPEEPHEALTESYTKPTRVIPSPFKTQPLRED
jgi:hypothetical protein